METGKPKIWSRLQPHGGTTVPKEIRDALGLKPGDVLLWKVDSPRVASVAVGSIREVTVDWPHKTSK